MKLKKISSLLVTTSFISLVTLGCSSTAVGDGAPTLVTGSTVAKDSSNKAVGRETKEVLILTGKTTKKELDAILGQPTEVINAENAYGEPENMLYYDTKLKDFDINLTFLDEDGKYYKEVYEKDMPDSTLGLVFNANEVVIVVIRKEPI